MSSGLNEMKSVGLDRDVETQAVPVADFRRVSVAAGGRHHSVEPVGKKKEGSSSSSLLLYLLVALGVVNLVLVGVGLGLAGTGLAQRINSRAPSGQEDAVSAMQTSGIGLDGRPKINIMLGSNYPPYDFLENLPGMPETVSGFGVEFAEEVCRIGGLDCRFIRDSYENCWTSSNVPGTGLLGEWYQACSTYTNTFLRQTGVQFGAAYTKGRAAGILTLLDENGVPKVPADTDLSGKVVAVVGGWATNGESLAYILNNCDNSSPFTNYTVITPPDAQAGPDAAMRALYSGESDAVYMYASTIEDRSNPEVCALPSCDVTLYQDRLGKDVAWIQTGEFGYQANGTTLSFSHQGSDINTILDPLVQTVIESQFYADLCHKWKVEKGFADISCFPNSFTDSSGQVAPGSVPDLQRPAEYQDCASGYCPCPATA